MAVDANYDVIARSHTFGTTRATIKTTAVCRVGEGEPMAWFALYLTVAAVVAVTAFVCAEWLRHDDVAAPDHPAAIAVLAGVLWPVVALGMTEAVLVGRFTRTPKTAAHQPFPLTR